MKSKREKVEKEEEGMKEEDVFRRSKRVVRSLMNKLEQEKKVLNKGDKSVLKGEGIGWRKV